VSCEHITYFIHESRIKFLIWIGYVYAKAITDLPIFC
jgi:hypothetical protein